MSPTLKSVDWYMASADQHFHNPGPETFKSGKITPDLIF